MKNKFKVKFKIPKGWLKVKSGRVRKGDRYNQYDLMIWKLSDDAFIGSPVSDYVCIIRKKPVSEIKIPEGWCQVTEGNVKESDRVWCISSKAFIEPKSNNLCTPVTEHFGVIRKREFVHVLLNIKIPDDWIWIQEGIVKDTDKVWNTDKQDFVSADGFGGAFRGAFMCVIREIK